MADEVCADGQAVATIDDAADRPPPIFEGVVHVGVESVDACVAVVAVADPDAAHAPHPDLNVGVVNRQEHLDVAAGHRGEPCLIDRFSTRFLSACPLSGGWRGP